MRDKTEKEGGGSENRKHVKMVGYTVCYIVLVALDGRKKKEKGSLSD